MNKINDISKAILEKLSQQGISVLPKTLKKYKHQGWMSGVFVADSNRGQLIIHSINPIKEHRLNRVWDKFYGLSKILNSHPNIPTSDILYAGLIGKKFVLVQSFIIGNRAGNRVLGKTIIYDKWKVRKKDILPDLLRVVADIHKINLKGFGWPVLDSDSLKGKYKNQKEFFEHYYPLWFREIQKADRRLSLKNHLQSSLTEFIKKTVDNVNYKGPAVLVHGDAINPGNILVQNKNRVALVDLEWSILADPAWEFCDLGWWKIIKEENLLSYFKAVGIKNNSDKVAFINRVKLYIPLWLLWGTYMHANDSNLDVYLALRKLLLEKTC